MTGTADGTARTGRRDCIALIVAGGRGERFGGPVPKQYRRLDGQTILRRTVSRFLEHPAVTAVQVVIGASDRALYDEAVAGLTLPPPVTGGTSRQESVRRGLEAVAGLAEGRAGALVLIHDAVRPMVDDVVIARVVDALGDGPAAIAAVPVTDTLKRGAGGVSTGTVDRSGLWHAQTPQGFSLDAILAAHRAAPDTLATDDAALAEQAGLPVALVAGHPDNLKITTEQDLERAERLLRSGQGQVRVGTGFDVHRFGPPAPEPVPVMLCGVAVEYDRPLEGHSDADVGLHALTDAILGTIGAGDIGEHFPPSDMRWRGTSSDRFLRHAVDLVAARGGRVVHVDLTLICERPKIGPHRARMVARLAELLDLPADGVSVKATTTEGLGFTGRREGIAAQAAATVMLG